MEQTHPPLFSMEISDIMVGLFVYQIEASELWGKPEDELLRE